MARLIDDSAGIAEVLAATKTIAVLGIRAEAHADRPAHYVPAYAARAGYLIYPVPVYDPEATTILGRPVTRSLREIVAPIDMVNVFRRPPDIPAHLEDILQKAPRYVWMQSGIRQDQVAKELVSHGISVIQDRCLLVELKRIGR